MHFEVGKWKRRKDKRKSGKGGEKKTKESRNELLHAILVSFPSSANRKDLSKAFLLKSSVSVFFF